MTRDDRRAQCIKRVAKEFRIEGLFEGQLTEEESWLFEEAIELAIAYRSYEGSAGFIGMAKVRLCR